MPVAGSGTVASYTVSHRSLDPAWQERAPYTTLVVELDEGPRVLAATDLQPSEVAIGKRVDVRIEARSDDFALLWATDRPAPKPEHFAGVTHEDPDTRPTKPTY
ncbi:MAG TPA: OB-fold domain-containing protein [Acidimicrobiales bacterium]|nr:OB-fold domain-containing protein [Acidimicrobiales bacterium]